MFVRFQYGKRVRRMLAMLLLLAALSPTAFAAGSKTISSPGDAKNGVVRIFTTESISEIHSYGTGSGFGVGTVGEETDIFVTNRHVIYDDEKICDYIYILLDDDALKKVYTRNGGFVEESLRYTDGSYLRYEVEIDLSRMIRCKVLYPTASDPAYPDFAILQAERKVEGRVALPLLKTEKVPDSETVWTIGYPGSADNNYNLDLENSEMKYEADVSGSQLFKGNISNRGRTKLFGDTYAITHSAQIDHGNSGGPLVTGDGAVIGINTYGFESSDTSNVGYYMSVYINYAINKLDELGLHYEIWQQSGGGSNVGWLIAAAVIACGLIAGAVFLLRKKKPDDPDRKSEPQRREYRLQSLSGTFGNRRFAINGVLRFGRDKDRNDLVYPSDASKISRVHCRLTAEGDELYLEDLGSQNGTFLNDQRLPPNQKVKLQEGDCLYLANSSERFRVE